MSLYRNDGKHSESWAASWRREISVFGRLWRNCSLSIRTYLISSNTKLKRYYPYALGIAILLLALVVPPYVRHPIEPREPWEDYDEQHGQGLYDGHHGAEASDRELRRILQPLLDFYYPAVDVKPDDPNARAINLVQSAVLSVPEKGRSATDVLSNVGIYMQDIKLSPEGWTAKKTGRDSFVVTLNCSVDGISKQAIWSVNLENRKVMYMNELGKLLSWSRGYRQRDSK
jgi:hypothetical protein